MKHVATVVDNQPGCLNFVEGESLSIGTKLYLPGPFTAIGAPLAGGFFAGEYLIGGERYGLIVASKAEGENKSLKFKKTDLGTTDSTHNDEDGLANCARLTGKNYPAAEFCRSLKAGGFDDWYLPSRDELAMLWRNLGPRRQNTPNQFREGAAEAFETDWYWSSTEHASYSIQCLDRGFQPWRPELLR
jgi:hypothetical protein